MRKLLFTISILLSFVAFAEAQTYYGTTDLKTFREGRDTEFRNPKETPLKKEDFPNFKGLNYFADDEKYRVKAKFTKTSDEKYFLIPTSRGTSKKYIKYGVASFKIDAKNYSL